MQLKRFLVKLLIHALIVFAIVHLVLTNQRRINFRQNQMTMAVESISSTTEVLFLGNSHVFSSIDPSVFSFNTINLTAGSWNYEAQLATLKANIHKAPNIQLCIIELDIIPFTLNTLDNRIRRFKGDLTSYFDLGLQYYQIPGLNPVQGFIYALKEHPPIHNVLNIGKKKKIDTLLKSTIVMNESCKVNKYVKPGFETVDVSINDTACLRSVKEVKQNSIYNYEAENKAALIEMLKLLQQKKIKVIFVRYPRIAPNTSRLEELKNIVHTVMPVSTVLDYEADKRFLKANFRDSNHLNISGASLLSHLLNDTISILARQQNIQLNNK